jgi:hypothetical protein
MVQIEQGLEINDSIIGLSACFSGQIGSIAPVTIP